MATAEIQYDPAALSPLETAGPTIEVIGTTAKRLAWALDDTTQEYLNGSFKVPTDIDTGGTVTFRVMTMAKTGAASKNVALALDHQAVDHNEDLDPAFPYTTEASGDKAMIATQDDLTEITWTETVGNLAWTAHDLVAVRISRTVASANNLVGDLYLLLLTIEIPLA